jgi:hypothetical protein
MEEFLRERLRPPGIDVPAEIDRAVLGAARRRLRFRRLAPVFGLAAAALLAAGLLLARRPPRPLDIVDAYRLALRLDRHETIGREWDRNGDGAVDRADVDKIARAAVEIGR